jgi:hypothetical protein
MKRMLLTVGSVSLLVLTAIAPRSASALTSIASPFGSAPVTVYVATEISTSNTYAIYQNQNNQQCFIYVLGTQNVLFDNFVIHGGPANDSMNVALGAFFFCGRSLTTPGYAPGSGQWIDMYGGDGNDVMANFTSTHPVNLFGERGDDRIVSFRNDVIMDGQENDDKLFAISMSGSSEQLHGGPGFDCLEDANASAALYDCGDSMDWTVSGMTPVNAVNCETVVSTCDP